MPSTPRIQHPTYPVPPMFSTLRVQHPACPAPCVSSTLRIRHPAYPASCVSSTPRIQHLAYPAPCISSTPRIQHLCIRLRKVVLNWERPNLTRQQHLIEILASYNTNTVPTHDSTCCGIPSINLPPAACISTSDSCLPAGATSRSPCGSLNTNACTARHQHSLLHVLWQPTHLPATSSRRICFNGLPSNGSDLKESMRPSSGGSVLSRFVSKRGDSAGWTKQRWQGVVKKSMRPSSGCSVLSRFV